MIVSMWMTRNVVSIAPITSVAEAAGLMARKHIRRLLVTERRASHLHLLGIVAASDILHAFPPDVNPFAVESTDARQSPTIVEEIMNPQPQTTTPETPIEEAAAMMKDQKVGALPVLHDGVLIGVITESDIFGAMVSLFTVAGVGARVTFDMSKGEDVFILVTQLAKKRNVRVVSLISAEQENRPVCVLRVAGENVDKLLDDIWASGHVVLNVLRFPINGGKR